MSTAPAAALSLVVLALGGGAPAFGLCGPRWRSVLLAPLAGSVIAALGAAGCLAIGGSVVAWFVGLSLVGWTWLCACLLVPVETRPRWLLLPWMESGANQSSGPVAKGDNSKTTIMSGVAAVCGVAAASWSLVALRAPWVGFDARGIWMLHALWFAAGHDVALTALRTKTMSFAHPSYPPLIGGSVALAWKLTGDHAYRLGVVIVACLNASGAMAVGWALFEVARKAAARCEGVAASLATSVGAVVSVLLVVAVFGVAGPFATNGYADMLWSSAAAGAIVYGLVLSGRATELGAAGILLAVSGLTKDEGIAVGMGIVVLITLRRANQGRRYWRALLAGAAGVAGLGAWPVLVRALGVQGNVANIGARNGDDLSRAHLTIDAMAPHLHVVVLAVPVALAGAFVSGRTRRAVGLGNDGWSWAAIAFGTAVIAFFYVTGPGNIEFWLATSVHRTTMFTAIAIWCDVGTWTVLGASALARTALRTTRASSTPRGHEVEYLSAP